MPKINSYTIFKKKKLFAYINQFPQYSGFSRRLIICEGNVYTEEKIVEEFINNEKININIIKLGHLNNGFTFFDNRNYSTRLITKRGIILAIELYVQNKDKVEPLELKIPLIHEEKFSKPGSPVALLSAFQNHNLNLKDDEV